MAIDDLQLQLTNEKKPSLVLSLRPKSNCINPAMDKNKFSNSDNILSRMDRLGISHASCSSYTPISEHQNNSPSERSLNNSQISSNSNLHRANCNNFSFDDDNMFLVDNTKGAKQRTNCNNINFENSHTVMDNTENVKQRTNCNNISFDDDSVVIVGNTERVQQKANCNNISFDQNCLDNTEVVKQQCVSENAASKEEVDLIELLGRDWPMQAGDSLTNILNSDYNYNKDNICKQDSKKYDSNHRLKHTNMRYSKHSERNRSMNPVSHILNDRKLTDYSHKDYNSKPAIHSTVNKHTDTSPPKSSTDQSRGLKTQIKSPSEDYLPGSSTSGNYQSQDSAIRFDTITNIEGTDLGIGSMVQVTTDVSEPLYGVIRWLGRNSANSTSVIAGVELEDDHIHLPLTLTDGSYYGKRLFECPTNRALFIPLEQIHQDERFSDQQQENASHSKSYHNILEDTDTRLFGNVECPAVTGSIAPLSKTSDLESVCGKFRGIQGHHNSCYLDATLFSMFTFTGVFDALLFRPRNYQDCGHYEEVQKVLREEIVNPLRKNLFVRADKVMKLRKLLEKLSSVTGLTCEEKDPEEFLNCLLSQILRADPFLKLSSGQEAFYYQLFVEKDERLLLPSVQQLFEQSFLASEIKLKQVPSCLIIQMPRFGKSFKMYPRILPSQLLDVTDIIDDSPRQCTVCGKLAQFECRDCFGQCGMGLESTAFCGLCLDTVHSHAKRSNHKAKALSVPIDFSIMAEHCPVPRLYMELFAVVCIETSHYVTFVKAGSGHDVPWCFFDSMADRKGEQNGYNIPEMVSVPDLPQWLSDDGARMLHEQYPNDKQLPEHAKRLMCDAYMCMYQSPDVMMYR